MGIFDDDDDVDASAGVVEADPDAIVDVFDSMVDSATSAYESVASTAEQAASDAVDAATEYASEAASAAEDYAAEVAQRAEDDPLGLAGDIVSTATSVLTPPMPDVDVDENGVSVGMNAGPYGALKGHIKTDDEGHLDVSGEANVALGEAASVGLKGSYQETDEGFKISHERSAQAVVEGVPLAAEVRAGYEDMGERGYKVTAGTSAGLYADAENMAEASLMAGGDISYSTVDGQQTIDVSRNITAEAEVLNEQVAEAKLEAGVGYTWGPDGERIILHGEASGTLGTEDENLKGTARAQYEYGTDAEGDQVSRVTVTTEASATSEPLGVDISASSTELYDISEEQTDEYLVDGTPADTGLDATYGETAEAEAPLGTNYVDYAEPVAESEPLVLEETSYAEPVATDGLDATYAES